MKYTQVIALLVATTQAAKLGHRHKHHHKHHATPLSNFHP
jgi:hypothetical protein